MIKIIWIFIQTLSGIYSAPKHENSVQGSSSSEEYLSNDATGNYFRDKNELSLKENQGTGADGYKFDENICKVIEDRTLCGYDRNTGEIMTAKIDVGNDCLINNDRIECGYSKAPYKHLRFRSSTKKESYNMLQAETVSSTKQDQNETSQNLSITTTLPPSISVSPKTADTAVINSNETSTVTQRLITKTTGILITKLVSSILSTNLLTNTTVKKFDSTVSPVPFSTSASITTNETNEPIHHRVADTTGDTQTENTNITNSKTQSMNEKLNNKISYRSETNIEKSTNEQPCSKKLNCPCQVSDRSINDEPLTTPTSRKRFKLTRDLLRDKRKVLRSSSEIKTSCVENQGRIVCYDYKQI